MSERSASKVGGSSFCSVIKKLSTDEPHLIPRVGAHPCPWKKMFRRPRELPVVAAVVGKKNKKGKNDGGRYEKEKESRGTIENHIGAVCFFTANRRSHGHCQPLDF